jgi:ATP-binding cassette subfamily B (MDR/TAP) protein 1
MNLLEWAYALVSSLVSMVCGSFSAIFAYYAPDPRYIKREITKYCYLLIGMPFATLLFNTVQHVFWDKVGENLTKRCASRKKMFTAVLRNEIACFDADENASACVAARLVL